MAENRLRNWSLGLVTAVVAAEVLYLAAANFYLSSDLLRSKLNRKPDRLSVHWSSAWTAVPGVLNVRDLKIRSRKPKREWTVAAEVARARVALLPLLRRTVRISRLQGEDAAFDLLRRHPAPAGPSPASGFASRRPGWKVNIVSGSVTGIRHLEIYGNRFTGELRLRADDIRVRPGNPVFVASARLLAPPPRR